MAEQIKNKNTTINITNEQIKIWKNKKNKHTHNQTKQNKQNKHGTTKIKQ